jgi:formylglycine-generating enzyme required for sulfatase activity/tRNA A-37 threonylcarbamoyl transferase component Bud32
MGEPDPALLRTVIGRALELPPEARADFAARACGNDPQLRDAVQRLLAKAGAAAPDFLEPPGRSEISPDHALLGDFELLRELGRGGMGVVYLARQRSLGRQVAVKVFVESLTTTQREIDRFHREARAAASLSHSGIVRVLTDGKTGNAHWFAMEFVDGHDLRREISLQIERNRLQPGEAPILPVPGSPGHMAGVASLCADVADALHHAHRAGLVHRDIKPANLLLARDGRVLISDFGLVRDETQGALTRTGEAPGTPHYMSPEQARVSQAKVDHRTDIYSLGVVLYELAALCRPFEGGSSDEILAQIKSREPRPLRSTAPEVARDLELICATAMAKDPAHRYRDAAAFAEDLRRFLRHEAIHARPPSLVERGRRWTRAHRRAVAGVAFLALGLALGGAAMGFLAHARGLARVSVEAFAADGSPLRGTVRARKLDSITGVAGSEIGVGKLGARGERFQPGWWRLILEVEGQRALELERDLEPGKQLTLTPAVRPDPPGNENMVRIEGGLLSLRDVDKPHSFLNMRDILVEPFWLDECEVTNAEYRRFLEATGHPVPRHWDQVVRAEHDELPVVCVSWQDARDFAEWNGKRLPTYTEWTWAARGAECRIYPWDDPVRNELRGNTQQRPESISNAADTPYYFQNAAPVRSHPAARTAAGLYHMFGNVSEWTGSPFPEPSQGSFTARPAQRLIAGYAWDAGSRGHTLENFEFLGVDISYANPRTGFRCARSVRPPSP